MACERYLDLIFKKIDKEISDEEDELLLAHMNECESCRADFSELSRIEHVLCNIPEYDVPDTFASAVTDKLRVNPTGKKKRGYRPYFSVAAACIVLVVVLFYNVFDGELYKSDKLTDAMPNAANGQIENKTTDLNENKLSDEDEISDTSDSYFDEELRTPVLFGVSGEGAGEASSSQGSLDKNASGRSGDMTAGAGSDSAQKMQSEVQESQESTNESAPDAGEIRESENVYTGEYSAPHNGGGGGAVSAQADSSDSSASSAEPQSNADNGLTMSAAPTDTALQNSDYLAVATFSIAKQDLLSVLDGLTYTEKDPYVYEMDISSFDTLKERVEALGLALSEEAQNPDSQTMLVIVTVN